MQNDIILLLLVLIIALCLGAGYWFFVSPLRDLRATAQEMQALLDATQNALAQSQQEMIALRQALSKTNVLYELDGTGDTDQYDMSGISELLNPKQVLDLSIEEDFHEQRKHKGSEKTKNDGEASLLPKPLDEDKPVQENHPQEPVSKPFENGSMYCQFCHTANRGNARFCNRCGQSLAETEALPQIVTEVAEKYSLMPMTELRQMKTPEAATERCRRAVEAIMAYNDVAGMPAMRWYISPTVVVDLVGGRPPNVKEYLTAHRAEIEAHHQKYRLSSGYNRAKAISIAKCIQIPEWPDRVLYQPANKEGIRRGSGLSLPW